jgi:O-antigen ligase
MNNISNISEKKDFIFWLMIFWFFSAFGIIYFIIKDPTIKNILIAFMSILGAIVLLRLPFIGLGFIIISTVVAEFLPRITIFTSITPIIGAFTLFAFLINKNFNCKINWKISLIDVLGFLLIFWMTITHPKASIMGDTRIWALTYAQLWALMWMAHQFIKHKRDHHILMVIILLGIIISALVAIQEVGSFNNLVNGYRVEGLTGGANTAARYFLYGIIILFYMQKEINQKYLLRLFLIIIIGLLTIALFLTESRSGVVLFLSFGFLQVLPVISKRQRSIFLVIAVAILFFYLVNFANIEILSIESITNSVLKGTDTVGYRYNLWKAGLKIALDYPITGVGVGRFPQYLPLYWQSSSAIRATTAHNTYISIFAEMGFVGFLIFITLIASSFISYIKILKDKDHPLHAIYNTWFILLIVLLIGAFTKTEEIDKFLWFLIGVSYSRVKFKSKNDMGQHFP